MLSPLKVLSVVPFLFQQNVRAGTSRSTFYIYLILNWLHSFPEQREHTESAKLSMAVHTTRRYNPQDHNTLFRHRKYLISYFVYMITKLSQILNRNKQE
jgi:hypothetical protein